MDSPEKKRARRSQTASTAAALSISSSSPSASFASPSASSSSSSAAAASMASIALSVTDLFGPSPLQKDRLADVPALPAVLQLDHSTQELGVSVGKPTKAAGDDAEIAAQFPYVHAHRILRYLGRQHISAPYFAVEGPCLAVEGPCLAVEGPYLAVEGCVVMVLFVAYLWWSCQVILPVCGARIGLSLVPCPAPREAFDCSVDIAILCGAI